MASLLRAALATLVAPTPPLMDLLRFLRFRGRGLVVLDLGSPAWRRPGGTERLLQVLDWVGQDPMVRALRVKLDGARGSHAFVQQLHVGLQRLVKAGKPVFGQLSAVGNTELYLGAACQWVFMLPEGELAAAGLATRMTFLGDALARLGVQVEVLTAGDFKSAGEPLVRSCPSPENRHAMQELLEDLQRQLVEGIAAGRGLEAEAVLEAMASVPVTAARAVELGLVDELAHGDQIPGRIEEILGFEPRSAGVGSWWRGLRLRQLWHRLAGAGTPVAVLRLRGPVVDRRPESGRRESIAADRVVPLLESLREDDAVQGVLITVDSGGGSVLASERIHRAVQRLQEAKPVVALFEGVAASGGYYLAVPSGSIVAQPGTVTGSIGVIGARIIAAPALSRLGIHGTTLRAAPSADLPLGARALSAPERGRLEALIDHYYQLFLRRVAGGRRRPQRAIEPVAGGRVWSGRAARDHGLVDRLGGFGDALDRLYRHLDILPERFALPRWDIQPAAPPPGQRLLRSLLAQGSSLDPELALLRRLAAWLRPSTALEVLLDQAQASRVEPLALMEWEGEG